MIMGFLNLIDKFILQFLYLMFRKYYNRGYGNILRVKGLGYIFEIFEV